MKTIIRNAKVLTMDAADRLLDRATIVVEEGLISSVGDDAAEAAQVDPRARTLDGLGHLVMPGLVNGHFHSSVNHLKGSLDSLPLEVFMLFESPSEGAAIAPRAAYVRTMLAALEMLKSGVTTVLDDAFFVPSPSPAVIDAIMQAYADCGIRATLALDQPDVPEIDKLPFLAEMLPPHLLARASAPPAMDAAGLLGCYRHLLDIWHGAADGRLRAAVSCSAPQRVTPHYFAALDAISREHHLPFYIHILETKLQRVLGDEKFGGRSLIHCVNDQGLLSDRMNIIHAIWIDEADIDLIAASGAVVAHNPISNLRLGSGVMPFQALRARGVPICLGTDEAIADDAVNMWQVAKLTGLIHNITDPDYQRWPRAGDVLDCLVRGGARALRGPVPSGQIAPGHLADLVMIDLDTLAFTPLNDIRRQLVYCETGGSVRMTMVNGEIVWENGRSARIDEPMIRAEARALKEQLAQDGGLAAKAAAEWLPYYRRMYLKAAGAKTPLQRWVGAGPWPRADDKGRFTDA